MGEQQCREINGFIWSYSTACDRIRSRIQVFCGKLDFWWKTLCILLELGKFHLTSAMSSFQERWELGDRGKRALSSHQLLSAYFHFIKGLILAQYSVPGWWSWYSMVRATCEARRYFTGILLKAYSIKLLWNFRCFYRGKSQPLLKWQSKNLWALTFALMEITSHLKLWNSLHFTPVNTQPPSCEGFSKERK